MVQIKDVIPTGDHGVELYHSLGPCVFKTTPTGLIITGGLVGHMVSFLIGLPSVKAMVIHLTEDGQYILQQDYDTQDRTGKWIHVTNIYYRERWFIDNYWTDTHRHGC